jgi:uncharacterized protein HemY
LDFNNLAWQWASKPGQPGNPQKILHLAEQAVALAPGQWLYRNTFGVVCYRQGLYTQAVPALEQSLRESREQAAAFDLFFLAMCHARLGHREQARAYHERAVRWFQEHRIQLPERWRQELNQFQAESAEVLKKQP